MGSHFSLNGTELWNHTACGHHHLKNGDFWHGRHGIYYVSVHMASKLSARTSSRDIMTTTSFLSNGMVVLWRLFFLSLNVLQGASLTPLIMPQPGRHACWGAMLMVIELVKQLMGINMSLYIPERHLWQADRFVFTNNSPTILIFLPLFFGYGIQVISQCEPSFINRRFCFLVVMMRYKSIQPSMYHFFRHRISNVLNNLCDMWAVDGLACFITAMAMLKCAASCGPMAWIC